MTARHLGSTPARGPARAFAFGAALALAALSVPSAYAAQDASKSKGNKNDKQTICHRTNSNTNPYVVNTPDKNGDLDGHAGHLGPIWNDTLKDQHIKWGDIIPAFDYNDHGTPAHFDGLNWTTEGQAIFNNGCVIPTGGGTTGGTTGTTTGTTTGGGGGGGTTGGFTGGGGGTVVTPPTGGGGGGTVLPRTGASLEDQVAYGAALLFLGAGVVLLTPRRRTVSLR